MEFWAYPYLIWYLLMFFFWMLAAHRQILFWLYLWQLKEYHFGRFWDHFSTSKGKSLFLNPLFAAKIILAIFAAGFYIWFAEAHALPLGSPVLFTGWILFIKAEFIFSLAVFLVFVVQGIRSGIGILKLNLLHPVITKKSVLLLAANHILFFGLASIIFGVFLAEMSMLDLVLSGFFLLLLDILLPFFTGIIVLAFQPLTIWEKNRILKRAKALIAARPDLITIGIAGSYGKSVTKELLAHILSQKYKVLKTQANQNTEIGVAQTIIKDLKPEHQFFVCEIGAVHKGRIKQVGEIVKPKIGILTGINQQHMAVFGSQQNIIDGKFELLQVLSENEIAILNLGSRIVKENFDKQKTGIKAHNFMFAGKDIFADNIKADVKSLAFDINYKKEKFALNTNARGAFMTEPILLAAAGAIAAGMTFGDVAAILSKTDFNQFNIKTRKWNGMNILDSTYSSNPDGAIAHLDYLKLWPGKKAIIMPCLIELGKSSKETHYQIGQKIGQVCDLAIITTRDYFKEIKKGATGAGIKPENIIFLDEPEQIKKLLQNQTSPGDTILLEGRLQRDINRLLVE